MIITRILVLLLIVSLSGVSGCATKGSAENNSVATSSVSADSASQSGQTGEENSTGESAQLSNESHVPKRTAGDEVLMMIVYIVAFAVGWQIGAGL